MEGKFSSSKKFEKGKKDAQSQFGKSFEQIPCTSNARSGQNKNFGLDQKNVNCNNVFNKFSESKYKNPILSKGNTNEPKKVFYESNSHSGFRRELPQTNNIIEDKEEGWVTVTKKLSKKAIVETEIRKIEVHQQPKERNDIQQEEKKMLLQIKKQRIKEEKMRKREDLARQLMQNMKKDTKIRVITQDSNISYKSTPTTQSNNGYPNNNLYAVHNYNEYPSIKNSFNNRKQNSLSKGNGLKDSEKWHSPSRFNSNNNQNRLYRNSNSAHFARPKSDTNHIRVSQRSSEMNSSVNESPVKRKVKSKDLINLEIMDLIEMKRKEQTKTKVPVVTYVPNKVEKKGKISEGKAKKQSTLKKNVMKQKKIQEELLLKILNEEAMKEKDKSLCKQSDSNNGGGSEKGIEYSQTLSAEIDKMGGKDNSCHSQEQLTPTTSCVSTNALPEDAHKVDSQAQHDFMSDVKKLINPIHSNKFREYCHHIIAPEINEILKELIELIVMFQERLYHQDATKAKVKRRYYCGLKEAVKHMNRVTCLIMAPNLKPSPGKGCVDELVNKVLTVASESGVPVFFGLTHRKLGHLCHRKVPVSCISIINIQGAQDKFQELIELIPKAKHQYEELLTKFNLSQGTESSCLVEKTYDTNEAPTKNITDSLLKTLNSK